jgi:hypothetical protein
MKRIISACLISLMMAACSPSSPPVTPPTLASLPSLTPSDVAPTETPAPIAALPSDEAPTDAPPTDAPPSETPVLSETPTPESGTRELLASEMLTVVMALTGSAQPPTATLLVYESPTPITETPTVTPSLTITPTITPSPSRTFTPSPTLTETPDLGALGFLALDSQDATFLPVVLRIPLPTLTVWAATAQAQIAATLNPPPTFAPPTAQPGITCPFPPPPTLSALLSRDPSLLPALGCPFGAPPVPTQISGAWQFFERGAMVYLAGSPGQIMVVTNDGRFRRFDDTFIQGVDPESGGEAPPAGLIEPVRGFGKVWRTNPDVRMALGWAVVPETGGSLTLSVFERGRAVALIARGETLVLVDDPGAIGFFGTWRVLPGIF